MLAEPCTANLTDFKHRRGKLAAGEGFCWSLSGRVAAALNPNRGLILIPKSRGGTAQSN